MKFEEPRMMRIPGGTLLIGLPSVPVEAEVYHRWHSGQKIGVESFMIGAYPITVGQYYGYVRAAKGLDNAPDELELNKPVGNVSWEDAQAYCQWLSWQTGKAYRLPTDAEWEWAARGGAVGTCFPWGNELDDRHAWYGGRAGTLRVGSFQANGYGLFDVIGNVWEWCDDRFDAVAHDTKAKNAPTGKPTSENRVLRGGSYLTTNPLNLWIAYRHEDPPDLQHECIGFRVAQSL